MEVIRPVQREELHHVIKLVHVIANVRSFSNRSGGQRSTSSQRTTTFDGMEMNQQNLEALAGYLQQTLSPDAEVRKPGEKSTLQRRRTYCRLSFYRPTSHSVNTTGLVIEGAQPATSHAVRLAT